MGSLRYLKVFSHTGLPADNRVTTSDTVGGSGQRWTRKYVAAIFTIQQFTNGRFLDAYETSEQDFSAVTRPAQKLSGSIEYKSTQRWVLTPTRIGNNPLRVWNIQQLSTGRFLDAHETSVQDFSVVTRTAQNNDSQKYFLKEYL